MYGAQVRRVLESCISIRSRTQMDVVGTESEQLPHRPIILIRSGCTLGPEPPLGGAAPAFPDAGTNAGGGPPVEPPGGGNAPPGGGKAPGGKGGIAPTGAGGEAFIEQQAVPVVWWRTYALLLVA